MPFRQRQYEALVDGQWVDGVADNVVQIGGKNTAIEAKYVDDWAASLRNPLSPNGTKPPYGRCYGGFVSFGRLWS